MHIFGCEKSILPLFLEKHDFWVLDSNGANTKVVGIKITNPKIMKSILFEIKVKFSNEHTRHTSHSGPDQT